MTPKERVLAVLDGKPVDRIPVHHSSISSQAASIVVGRPVIAGGDSFAWEGIKALWNGGEEAFDEMEARAEKDALAITEALEQDIHRCRYWPSWSKSRPPVRKISEYTYLFGQPDKRWYTMTYHPELELLTREDGEGSHVYSRGEMAERAVLTEDRFLTQVLQEEEQAMQPSGIDIKTLSSVYDKYSSYIVKQGGGTIGVNVQSENDLLALHLWPELYARKLTARAEQIVKQIPRYAEAGMQISFSGADFCSNIGPIIAPESIRKEVIPTLKRVVDAFHAAKIRILYASDGNFWPVADDFFYGAGIDGWYEVDKSSGMDLRRLRQQYPGRLFLGNIRTQVLHRGTPEDVKREVLECMEVSHDLGGIVVGASNLIMPGTPPQNLFTMLETIHMSR